MAICTTKTAILSGGQQVVPVHGRVQRGPRVGHGQTVVRVRDGAQALLQLVALAALRSRSPDRLRGPADAAPGAAVKAADAAQGSADAASATAAAADCRSAPVQRPRRRPEREVAGRRRFGDESRRQAHAVYL